MNARTSFIFSGIPSCVFQDSERDFRDGIGDDATQYEGEEKRA